MTLLCKCNWCGNIVEYSPEIKSLEFDGVKYHYCTDCVIDVNVALSVGKNGEQGKYKEIADCWTELHKELTKWYNAPVGLRSVANRELEKAYLEFNRQMNWINGVLKE